VKPDQTISEVALRFRFASFTIQQKKLHLKIAKIKPLLVSIPKTLESYGELKFSMKRFPQNKQLFYSKVDAN